MTMTPNMRKFALTTHVTSSVGLLGSIAAFLILTLAGLNSQDAQTIRAAYLAMDLIARFIIVPLAFASLLTGLIQSLGTSWHEEYFQSVSPEARSLLMPPPVG
jgi:ABC-type nitrate/sulfonate/bicarbonate transport system permease component